MNKIKQLEDELAKATQLVKKIETDLDIERTNENDLELKKINDEYSGGFYFIKDFEQNNIGICFIERIQKKYFETVYTVHGKYIWLEENITYDIFSNYPFTSREFKSFQKTTKSEYKKSLELKIDEIRREFTMN